MTRKPAARWVALGAIATSGSACARGPHHAEPPASTYAATRFALATDAGADTVTGAAVSSDFFPASDVRPLLGRFFVAGEYGRLAPPVVVLGHDLWERRFHAIPGTVGTRIRLNGRDVTVVGVAPPGFAWPEHASVWVPRSTP